MATIWNVTRVGNFSSATTAKGPSESYLFATIFLIFLLDSDIFVFISGNND